jgi:uncharacterized protein YwgA
VEEAETMTTYDFVHLVISAAGGRIEGRTKLQNVVYFVGVLTEWVQNLGYRPHYYGPFSPAVAGAVQELRGLKFLEQHISANDTTEEGGFEMTRYTYTLTPEGKQVADEKAAQWPNEWARITAAVRRLNESDVRDYVRLAIAAKTDLLARQTSEPLSESALRKKATEHGWKAFNDTQYAEALQFLRTVVNTQAQPKPASG